MEPNPPSGDTTEAAQAPPPPPSPPALDPSQGFDLFPESAVVGRQMHSVAAQAGASGTSSLPTLPLFPPADLTGLYKLHSLQ